MEIKKSILTNSSCYKTGRTITPQGIMTHSTATPGGTAKDFISYWNGDIDACTNYIIDDTGIYQLLPETHRSWHAGSPANDMYISYEICEPGTFSYNGQWQSMGNYDPSLPENIRYFRNVYEKAVWLSAYFCKKYGWKPDKEHVLCHYEGFLKGLATEHVDVTHWFPKHGKSMDTFRADVKAAMGNESKPENPKPEDPKPEENVQYYVQAGSFKDEKMANSLSAVLNKKGFQAFVKKVNKLYKIQAGAFRDRENAAKMVQKLKDAGFESFIIKKS